MRQWTALKLVGNDCHGYDLLCRRLSGADEYRVRFWHHYPAEYECFDKEYYYGPSLNDATNIFAWLDGLQQERYWSKTADAVLRRAA